MISVCMPTYNGGKYIKKQMDSILSQLGDFDEVIISDDSSSIENEEDSRTITGAAFFPELLHAAICYRTV